VSPSSTGTVACKMIEAGVEIFVDEMDGATSEFHADRGPALRFQPGNDGSSEG